MSKNTAVLFIGGEQRTIKGKGAQDIARTALRAVRKTCEVYVDVSEVTRNVAFHLRNGGKVAIGAAELLIVA